MKALILNFKLLEELELSTDELLFIYSLHSQKEPDREVDLEKLEEKRFIKIIEHKDEEVIILRNKSIEIIELLTVEVDSSYKETKTIKKSQRAVSSEVEDRINEYRELFRGLKASSMGSPKSCKQKLTRWMKENPDYTFDDILQAARLYIQSLNGDYRYLQRADYFIFKQANNREEDSRLSAFIEDIGSYIEDDWTTNLN